VASTGPDSEKDKQETKRQLADEWECPLFSLNSPIESLTLSHIVTHVVDGRPLIWVGPDAAVQHMSADLSALDPSLQSVPLQLEAGGRVERFNFSLDWRGAGLDSGKNPILDHGGVVRQLHWVNSPPIFVKAQVDKSDPRRIITTFSELVKSADFKSGVTIEVNGVPARVLRAVRQEAGDAVRYEISTVIGASDSATWAYDVSAGTIQNLDGDEVPSIAPKIAIKSP
jgi:hypothetical protein